MKEQLLAKLEKLEDEKWLLEMDDYCMTRNRAKWDKVNDEITEVKKQLREVE